MAAGFSTMAVKDANGVTQNIAVYVDGSGNYYPAPTGTDAAGHILGLLGQNVIASSPSIALAAPNIVRAAAFTRPTNATATVAGNMFSNSTSATTPMTYAICPANGVPVNILKGKMLIQTSGGAGVTLTGGQFRLHLFGQTPASPANDGVAFLAGMVNWAGTMEITLSYQGSDYSVGEAYPTFGNSVYVTPAGGSSTIYGLLESRFAFTPPNAGLIITELMAQ